MNTEGFACPNQQCPYYGITDAHIHALVGDGKHGRAERIQTFRGPACRTTFTAWLTRAGQHAQTLHQRFFSNLRLPHIQLDELRTRLRCARQVLWLWLAIDPLTRDSARALSGSPHTTCGAHAHPHTPTEPGRLFASRSLRVMGSISTSMRLSAHFGQWLVLSRRGRNVRQWQVAAGLIYGQVKKSYRRRRLIRVSQVMRFGTEAADPRHLTGIRPLWTTQHGFH